MPTKRLPAPQHSPRRDPRKSRSPSMLPLKEHSDELYTAAVSADVADLLVELNAYPRTTMTSILARRSGQEEPHQSTIRRGETRQAAVDDTPLADEGAGHVREEPVRLTTLRPHGDVLSDRLSPAHPIVGHKCQRLVPGTRGAGPIYPSQWLARISSPSSTPPA